MFGHGPIVRSGSGGIVPNSRKAGRKFYSDKAANVRQLLIKVLNLDEHPPFLWEIVKVSSDNLIRPVPQPAVLLKARHRVPLRGAHIAEQVTSQAVPDPLPQLERSGKIPMSPR